ncbi:autotransporter outer membrane beta-barrel domain-containing protein [Pseudomonas protegens]|uniref:autotransporter outer membrane beta-barrel domain-containing protein n=1 Tax=Pseudomonas protegens TaxID=380021 RepID=UPI003EBA54C0
MKKSLLAISIALSSLTLAESKVMAAHTEISDQAFDTSGFEGYGVAAKGGDTVTATNVDIKTSGEHAVGAFADGAGSYINYQGGTIGTSGRSGHGLQVLNGAHIKADNLTIHTTGTLGRGVQAQSGSLVELSNSRIKTEGGADGNTTVGVSAATGGKVVLSNTSVLSTGDSALGIIASGGGSIIEMTGGSISITGNASDAVLAMAGGNSIVLDDVAVSTTGDSSRGILANGLGTVISMRGGSVTTAGTGSLGVAAGGGGGLAELANMSVETFGSNAHGLQANLAGTLNAMNVNITTHGDNATGVRVVGNTPEGAIVNLKDSHVRTEGAGAWGADVGGTLNVDGGSLISAQHGALTATRDAIINLSNGAQVIGGNGTLLSVSDEANSVSLGLDNQVYAEGDIVFAPGADSDANGTLDSNTNVSLRNASYWKGKTDAIDTLSLNQDSQWTVTGDSTVGQLSLDRGRVAFDVPDAGTFKTLSVTGDLSGNGSFLLNADLSTVQGDLLKVSGQIEGKHTLIVADSGREAQGEALMLVDGNGGAGKFDLYGGKVDAGAFRYELEQRGDDWYLARNAEDLSKGSNAAVGQHAASAEVVGAQMNSLVKRLGELRMGKDDGGLWTRGFSKEQHIDTGSSRAFQQQVNGFEIGADKAIPFYNGKLYLGGMVGKGEARQNFGEGSKGTIDSAMLGSYATYVDHSGVYVNSVLTYTHLENKVDIPSNIGEKIDAKYKNHAVSVDVEVGKQIDLGQGWFVEPQLEVQAFRVGSGDYTASNGLKVEQDAVTSVQSRVGSLFGRNLKLDNGMTVQPYAKVSWLTEHAGDSNVKVNGTRLDSKLPGSRAEIGGGVILQTAAKHKFYVDAEYGEGEGIEQPYAINIGYRYMW